MTWWPALYDDLLADVLLAGTSDVDDTVQFLADKLRLTPGARVFDQCCGTGRLAIALARHGAQVIGVDQAASYIERARAAGTTARFDVGDAFEYVPDRPCQGAINWWTSFGYLPDDDANTRMLRRAFEALVPGGRFALDYPNVPNLYATFRPHEITRRGEVTMLRESRLDIANGLLHKKWTFITGERRSERDSVLRLYTPDRLAQLLGAAGFVDLEYYGGVDGAPLSFDRPRCIVVGARP
jgi:SAM-dependent methyltransferase